MKSLAATALLLLGTALAEDDLAALVRDLGSEDFATRDAATRRLTEIGEPARAFLEQARWEPDAEVQMRAGRILAVLDVRRRIDEEYEHARKALGGDTPTDAARRVWLDVLYGVARGDDRVVAPLFAPGTVPPRFWDTARDCPLHVLADLGWVEVIPSRRLGWLGEEIGADDVMVMAALPEEASEAVSVPESYVRGPRALILRPVGAGWKVRSAPAPDRLVEATYDDLARTERQRKEWAAGVQTVSALASGRSGASCYRLAQALDGVGDFGAALRAFERCQPTGQWPDYCIVHRYFDLMRLGRRGDAARVLREEPGDGSCEYIGRVIAWARGEMKAEDLIGYAQASGSYEAKSVHYYLGMERLLAGDVDRAKEHLARCATGGDGCYEQTFAADALWLLEDPEEGDMERGEEH